LAVVLLLIPDSGLGSHHLLNYSSGISFDPRYQNARIAVIFAMQKIFLPSLSVKYLSVIPSVLLLLCLLENKAVAQSNEVGIGIGGTNYTGDVVQSFGMRHTRPGGFLLYRRNFTDYLSVRGNFMFGGLAGSDNPPFDALAQQRDTAFSTTVAELTAIVEYHFLDYKKNVNLLRWSPYFFIGAGVSYFGAPAPETPSHSRIQPVVPVGIGFKYILSPEFSLSAEAGIRKTFFDYIDNVSDSDSVLKNYEYGNRYNNDWYYFIGVSISYTFWTIPCPYLFSS